MEVDSNTPADVDAQAQDTSSDAFRMSSMKVLPCSKRYVHDWTECPYAHPQEKARRRDPRMHTYTGIACPSMKKEGSCAFGDHCPYAHNVFEYWLHPTRYRTQLCNDGSNCKRKICFFAHSLDELRVPACKPFVSPEALASAAASSAADAEAKRRAATVGSPLAASFHGLPSATSILPTASPMRNSLDSQPSVDDGAPLPVSLQGSAELGQMPSSPSTEESVQAAMQQLQNSRFTAQEQQVIELVTSMLAQDKISPAQAASILQQMLPSTTLSQLQNQLVTPPQAAADEALRRHSDPLGLHTASQAAVQATRSSMGILPSMERPQATYAQRAPPMSAFFQAPDMSILLQQQAGTPVAQSPFSSLAGHVTLEQMAAMQAAQGMGATYGGSHMRSSMESERSSFDTMGRLSMDTPHSQFDYGASTTPRTSLDNSIPAPMYPQYWTGQQLTTVPEGMPMLNSPKPRRSSGAWDSDRLSADLSRMSFEAKLSAPAPTANPFSSSLFASAGPQHPFGGSGADAIAPLPIVPPRRSLSCGPVEGASAAARLGSRASPEALQPFMSQGLPPRAPTLGAHEFPCLRGPTPPS